MRLFINALIPRPLTLLLHVISDVTYKSAFVTTCDTVSPAFFRVPRLTCTKIFVEAEEKL